MRKELEMKKLSLLAATALIASNFTPLLVAPAVAAPTIVGHVPTHDELQAACDALVQPNANSGFTATVKGDHREQVGAPDVVSAPFGAPYPVGEPEKSGLVFSEPSVNPGQDDNIFATVSYTLTQAMEVKTKITTTTTYQMAFDCEVSKLNKSGKVVPPGLQRPGQVSATWQEVEVTYGTEAAAPEVTTKSNKNKLICNKPQDVWIAKNDYDDTLGPCSDELFEDAGGVIEEEPAHGPPAGHGPA